MTDLMRVKTARVLVSARFWVAIFVVYMTWRELSVEQTMHMLSVYYLLTVVLEYPMGVVADRFSHKWSTIVGYLMISIVFLLFSKTGVYEYYFIVYMLSAISATLISGSDTALFHDVSKNFKKDLAQNNVLGIIISVGALAIGSIAFTFDPRLPFYLTSAVFFIAAVLLMPVKMIRYDDAHTQSLIATAKKSILFAVHKKILFHFLLLAGVFGAINFNMKWLYNPLFMELNISLTLWGGIAGGAVLMSAFGTLVYKKMGNISLFMLMGTFLFSLFLMGVTQSIAASLGGLLFVHFLRGYVDTQVTVDMNTLITSDIRASVLSLQSLLIHLGAAGYVALTGFVLERSTMFVLMIMTIVLFIIFSSVSLFKIAQAQK